MEANVSGNREGDINYITIAFFFQLLQLFSSNNYLVDSVGSSGILKGKQKLGVTFNFDKQDIMCKASEGNSEK